MALPLHWGLVMRFAITLVAAALPLAGCVTSANRCLSGYRYAPQYDACLQDTDGGGEDAAIDAAIDAATDAAIDASDARVEAATTPSSDASDASAGLGRACQSSADCTGGRATYCLKDPTQSPTDPGICSIPQCTASECTSAYGCCDCSAALITGLKAWPDGVCVPAADVTTVEQFGCKCQ